MTTRVLDTPDPDDPGAPVHEPVAGPPPSDDDVREVLRGVIDPELHASIVDLGMALAHDPSVLLLDEPSSGIAQRETEALGPLLLKLRDDTGCALLVIEHDMPLLSSVCDRLVALELGRVIAEGTADQLKEQVGGERIEVTVAEASQLEAARSALGGLTRSEVGVDEHTRTLTAPVSGGVSMLVDALRALDAAGVGVLDAGIRRPTLDDVFLTLTGSPESHAHAATPQGAHR